MVWTWGPWILKLRTEAFGEFNVLQCEVLPSSHTIGIILFKLAGCGRPIGHVCHARRRAMVGIGRPAVFGWPRGSRVFVESGVEFPHCRE